MTKRYKKKPVEIEALLWTGDNVVEVVEFCSTCYHYYRDNKPVLMIETLEGPMRASVNDYVIRGVKGEFYACKPDVFNLTYDQVD